MEGLLNNFLLIFLIILFNHHSIISKKKENVGRLIGFVYNLIDVHFERPFITTNKIMNFDFSSWYCDVLRLIWPVINGVINIVTISRVRFIFHDLVIYFRDKLEIMEFLPFRQCNGSSSGYEGCEYLCCSRGHVTRTEEVLERCDCKYISCCYVKCKTCRKVMKTYECK